ncbi:MAG TPA: hypothetical protein VHX59_25560 [Mycobacteriales bacterium]|jgi:hypothetical protein|nr:hypothetical protein [Mycobacteriales bacterium]
MSHPSIRNAAARWTHPLAWWLWALGIAAASIQTTNPLLLTLLALAVGYVVAARRATIATSRIYQFCCVAALFTVIGCLVVQVAFGDQGATRASVLAAFCFGARIGVAVLAVGAAAVLVSPLRLLGPLPLRGLMILSRVPSAMTQVRRARKLRAVGFGRAPRALPAALSLARERARIASAALDARAYGEAGRLSRRWGIAEFAVVAAGAAAAACFALSSTAGLMPDPWLLQTPTVPALAALGVLCAVLPAHLTPAPPAPRGTRTLRTKAAG